MLERFTLVVDFCPDGWPVAATGHSCGRLHNSFEIPIAQSGAGSQVLICVNGMQQTMAGWAAVLKRMAATDYRTVVFDFPNQGRAITSSAEASLTPLQQVQILAAVVDGVSPRTPVALLGGSWGALLAAAYAALFPDRVTKLLLCAFHTRPSARVRDIASRGRTLIDEGRADEVATLFLDEFANRMPPSLQGALRTQFRKLRPGQIRQMYDQGLLLMGDGDLDAMVDLRQITAETLVVNGELDPLIDHTQVEEVVRRLRAARLRLEPDAGHFLHLERPEIVNTYAQFLTRRSRRPNGALAARGRAARPKPEKPLQEGPWQPEAAARD